jgi:hypothetical protein
MILADVYLDMNTADADDTVLTTAIMAAGTVGPVLTWTVSPIPPTPFTMSTHRVAILDEIKVGSTVYPIGHGSKAVKYNHNTAGAVFARAPVPTGKLAMTVAGHVTFGQPDAGAGHQLFDYWAVYEAVGGDFLVLQLDNGGSNGYAVNLESNWNGTGSATTHSNYIVIIPGGTYWCCMQANFLSGSGRLAVYSQDGSTLIGTATVTMSSIQNHPGTFVDTFKWGNNETGTAAGTFSYMENTVLDYSSAKFPIVPAFSSLVPIRRGNRSRRRFIAQQD